jgi:hypothetical protein
VKRVAELLDWEDCEEKEGDWSVAWIDGRVIDKAWYRELRPLQRVNHFPGTRNGCIYIYIHEVCMTRKRCVCI